MATPFYLQAPAGDEQDVGFLDRLGERAATMWDQTPPEAFFALASAFAKPRGGTFGMRLAEGLTGVGQAVQQDKKRKGLASAFDSILPTIPESQRPMFAEMVKNDPQALMQAYAGQMFSKPSESWKPVDIDGDGRNDFQQSSITGEYKDMPKTLSEEERLKKAGVSNTNVTVNGGGSDKQIFEVLNDSYKAANTANVGLNGLREAEKALKGPGIYGAYADERLLLAKVAAAFGADPTAVVNTETFKSAIAPQVAAMIRASVGAANISNSDREFAEKASGADAKLDKKSLERLVSIGKRASEAIIRAHKERLDKVYPGDKGFVRERALFDVPFESGPKPVATRAEYDALPPGTEYIAPDGTPRVKK